MVNDPYALPNPVVLSSILLFGVIVVPLLTGYALVTWVRCASRPPRVPGLLRGAAALATGAAIGVYWWGALHMFRDETATEEACNAAVGPDLAGDVDRYETAFIPLRFGCHVDGSGTYDAMVPGYVNPSVLVLAVLAVVLVVLARRAGIDHARTDPTGPDNGLDHVGPDHPGPETSSTGESR